MLSQHCWASNSTSKALRPLYLRDSCTLSTVVWGRTFFIDNSTSCAISAILLQNYSLRYRALFYRLPDAIHTHQPASLGADVFHDGCIVIGIALFKILRFPVQLCARLANLVSQGLVALLFEL